MWLPITMKYEALRYKSRITENKFQAVKEEIEFLKNSIDARLK